MKESQKLLESFQANLKENEDNAISAKINFKCQECGYEWSQDFDDYFEDEEDLENVIDSGEMDCPKCGGNDVKSTSYKIKKSKSNTNKKSNPKYDEFGRCLVWNKIPFHIDHDIAVPMDDYVEKSKHNYYDNSYRLLYSRFSRIILFFSKNSR